jgi:hypothetical protein
MVLAAAFLVLQEGDKLAVLALSEFHGFGD